MAIFAFLKSAKKKNKKIFLKKRHSLLLMLGGAVLLTITSGGFFFWQKNQRLTTQLGQLERQETSLKEQLTSVGQELEELKNQDQYLRNEKLQTEIEEIEKTYNQAVLAYEKLLELKQQTNNTQSQDEQFAEALSLLAERDYASASGVLVSLEKEISQKREKLATSFKIPENVPAENAPPSAGYRQQKVTTDVGVFLVSLVAADLNSTQVIVDTASESDCHDNCPTLPLATYVARNGAFAGVNGAYFCPAEYPSCANRKNSFDTLLMNKNKVYFNSANNIYSTLPAVIFSSNTARFVTHSLEWGRDTGVDAVIANQPLLTFNGQLYFTGGGDPKQGVKSGRSFVGTTGSTIYIGVVHNATVAESARVVHALGINSALNLDSGGSTALWYSGHKVGPGRNLANGVLLVRK